MSEQIHFPSQCPCGHIYLEKYQWKPPQNDKGLIGFAYCGFCRNRENVYRPIKTPLVKMKLTNGE